MELASLLTEARDATPATRIAWRDSIAAHGPRAVEAIKPWLRDPALAAFAVRVIERAGSAGASEDLVCATEALQAARNKAPSVVKGDIDWALRHLRQLSQLAPTTAKAAASTQAR